MQTWMRWVRDRPWLLAVGVVSAAGILSGLALGLLTGCTDTPGERHAALNGHLAPTDGLAQREVPAKAPPSPAEPAPPIVENAFLAVADRPLSTFSADVDTASYSLVLRELNSGRRPPRDVVRIEELVNYFPYRYDGPSDGSAFAVNAELSDCPWQPEHVLLRIGIRGRSVSGTQRPAANLVFLVDVSGSMSSRDKLPLVRDSLRLLLEQLDERDRVAIVTYAGDTRVALASTPTTPAGKRKANSVLDGLTPGGGTNAGSGIHLAYEQALAGRSPGSADRSPGSADRVILCTDGDFNVGVTSRADLEALIAEKAKTGVFLSTLGFGTGNYRDGNMELLADRGNGNYAYIGDLRDARKALVEQMLSTLVTIASDVKFQVDFNPARVREYRLIGYENRLLADKDFNDDRKDAGEVGAGHTVTALYQLVPVGAAPTTPAVDPSKYGRAPMGTLKPVSAAPASAPIAAAALPSEWLTVRIRHKLPGASVSTRADYPVGESQRRREPSAETSFAAAAAGFGMILRDSPHRGAADWKLVRRLAEAGDDASGHRREFVELIDTAARLVR